MPADWSRLQVLLALVATVWLGVFSTFALFQIYRPTTKPRPKWLTALELPLDSPRVTPTMLLIVSVLGLFLELLMIRWISSELTIFAYFKNFVLIACFLGFGLGAHLSRQPINLAALLAPMLYFAFLIKLPWHSLRTLVRGLTAMLGSSTEVDVWGVPNFAWNGEMIGGMGLTLALVIPLFALLSLIFIPIGQATARMIEESKDGIKAYSINIVGSLIGILLYTGFCLLYQPPAVWFAAAGIMLLIAFPSTTKVRLFTASVIAVCVLMVSLPDSRTAVTDSLTESMGVGNSRTEWSPYQKLQWSETVYKGEPVAYQLMTNDSWYQYVVNLSDDFIRRHQTLFENVPPEANAYNMPYYFNRKPNSVLVLGSGMGNDVAAALRHNAGKVMAVEIDPLIIEMGKKLHPERPYSDPRVTIVNDDARSYMQNSDAKFDLILFSLLDSHTTSSHYSNIRIDNYVYTREALSAARKLLSPDGIMVVKFLVNKPFIAGRLKAALIDVFGTPPVQFGVDQSFNVSPGTFFIAGNADRIAASMKDPFLANHVAKHSAIRIESALVTTDDWPFFYQHAPGLPSSVILISCVLILVCWQVMKRTAVPITEISWPFFLLGAAFMLMESQIVSRMALLFGTTWLVNAITISGLLLLIVGANSLESLGWRLPSNFAYAGLLLTILAAYFVPAEALFSNSMALKLCLAIATWCSPVFFASIIFIRWFSGAKFAGSALGSNILGALVGGLLESLSLWIGLKALLILALAVYITAWMVRKNLGRSLTPAS